MKRTAVSLLLSAAIVSLSACEDPASKKPKAVVSEAPVVATPPTPTVKPPETAPATAPTMAPAGANVYVINPQNSQIGFTGSKVTGKHDGTFNAFNGKIEMADKPETAKISIEIDMSQFTTENDKLTTHLKSPDFFDIEKFPKATFSSTEIKAGGDNGASHTITGTLELHGVRKTISFPANIKLADGKITSDSEFAINRKDFGIAYAGKADDLIRDQVVIRLKLSPTKG